MNKHIHSYTGCDHALKFCAHCDTVYCTKCSKEWTNHTCNHWTYAYGTSIKQYDPLTPYYTINAGDNHIANAFSANDLGKLQVNSNYNADVTTTEVKLDHKHD